MIEPLESRIAPAAFVHSYTDVDGDLVTVTFSKGNAAVAMFDLLHTGPFADGMQLRSIKLGGDQSFAAASVTIVAKRQDANHDGLLDGDGHVDLGYLDATGIDLGAVKVPGDLGELLAGAGTEMTHGVRSLSVASLGRLGLTTGAPALETAVIGKLGALTVSGDVTGAAVTASFLGSVTIGGSLAADSTGNGGRLYSEHDMGAVKIGGDLRGGVMANSGMIVSNLGKIASVRIGGSLSSNVSQSGSITSGLDMGPVSIGGDFSMFAHDAGLIQSGGKLASVSIGGSFLSFDGIGNGGRITSGGDMGPVKIGGRMQGYGGTGALTISAGGALASVTVGGSFTVGEGVDNPNPQHNSGAIFSLHAMGPVKIGGDMSGRGMSSCQITSPVSIASVSIGGSMIAGGNTVHGLGAVLIQSKMLGPISVGGDLVGGQMSSTKIDGFERIASVTIGGSVRGGPGAGSGEIVSASGHLGPIKIGGDLAGMSTNSGAISGRTISSIAIGGSFLAGTGAGDFFAGVILCTQDLGPVTIKGDVRADASQDSAKIHVGGKLASLTIGGSLLGFGPSQASGAQNSDDEGQVYVGGALGPVRIAGSVLGGNGTASAEIRAGSIVSITIGGSLTGRGPASGQFASFGDLGTVKIGGDVQGSTGASSGRIGAGGKIGSITIGGSLIGNGSATGAIFATGDLGSVRIGGDIRGGSSAGVVDSSGYIQGAHIGSVFVGGSILAGTETGSTISLLRNGSIRADNDIGSITVLGSIVGSGSGDPSDTKFTPVVISARGKASLPATGDLAIGRLTVGGDMKLAVIYAGYDVNLMPKNADAQIGTVTVGGDWISTNLVAGVQDSNGTVDGFGNSSDVKISGAGVKDNADRNGAGAISKIASVIIKGSAIGHFGTAPDYVTFGIEAQQIGAMTLGGTSIALLAGAGNDVMMAGNQHGNSHALGATLGTTIDDGFSFHAFEVLLT